MEAYEQNIPYNKSFNGFLDTEYHQCSLTQVEVI